MNNTVFQDMENPLDTLKLNLSSNNNDSSIIFSSIIPQLCMSEPCILGIDEAGRGPVLGPMVYGVCYCVKNKEHLLKESDCADSKSLTEQKREQIFELLCKESESIGWAVDIISPNKISNSMLRRQKHSLNELSHDSAIQLIKLVRDAGVNLTEVYVDTVGPPEKYQEKLSRIYPGIKVTVSKKADSLFPIVSAASICAKVTRDIALKTWKFPENLKVNADDGWGSGYPNDPTTKAFLMDNIDTVFGFPQIVRFSWSTADKILKDNAIPVEWSDEEDATPSDNMAITSFFKKPTDKIPKHTFFTERCLETTDSI